MGDEEILARTLWGEGRGEGRTGMHAIANVIMNRVAGRKWWGLTVREVCLKPYQFSCWLPSDPNFAKLKSVGPLDKAFATALDIAGMAANGDLPDITHEATHYKVVGTPASWAKNQKPIVTIGHHEFYKLMS